ncbi:MAG: cob(I)yrinic acid a,c-diamide adenosyltransferase [Pseudomonadales bacterium]
MGKRLSKIYTKTGDKGETGLGDGSRIAKDHIRVQAMGSCDELNSHLGMAIEELKLSDQAELAELVPFFGRCQHRIFDLGGEISIPGFKIVSADHVTELEQKLDELNEDIPPLENFIMQGGSRLIASIHIARAVARRAERDLVTLGQDHEINEDGLRYLNRLSDLLFVAARFAAKATSVDEILWEQG